MELNKENVKKLMKLITFTLVLAFLLRNIDIVKNAVVSIFSILSPFLLGAGIAFILNIPMSCFEKLWKTKTSKKGTVKKSKMKRPISILISLILIFFIISFIIKLVIPQLISVIVMFAHFPWPRAIFQIWHMILRNGL